MTTLTPTAKHFAFAGVLARGVVSQVILAAGNFAVTLILLRYGSNTQYAYYVLVFGAVILMISLQGAFVGPALVNQLARLDSEQRADLIGGLYAGQRRLLPRIVLACLSGIAALWLLDLLNDESASILLVAIGTAWAALYRQFARMVSNAYRDSSAALTGDLAYVAILVGGAALGIRTSVPAIVTLAFMGLGAGVGGVVNSRLLWKRERWNINAGSHVWRKIAAVGAWTGAGSVAHWALNQGYNYLVVAYLNLTAIAALGSTRTLMMPVNLLSTGVSALMLSTVSVWLIRDGARGALRRVTLSAAAISGLALLYPVLFWPVRDFIFADILHKYFAQRDLLLVLWSVASVVMVGRDQFVNFLLARTRYRALTGLTVTAAIASLTVSYCLLRRIGVTGAPLGVLTGEIVNLAGLILLSRLEVRRGDAKVAVSGSR
jgi:O-antigen/teichoic acid export membrane protein